jgi:hypothetical protein
MRAERAVNSTDLRQRLTAMETSQPESQERILAANDVIDHVPSLVELLAGCEALRELTPQPMTARQTETFDRIYRGVAALHVIGTNHD